MNLKNVCRTCLRLPNKSVDLFKNNEILKRIDLIASIKIENINELSNKICEDCLNNINHLFKFRKLIINTNNDLQSRIQTLKETNYTFKPREKKDETTELVYDNFKLEPEIEIREPLNNVSADDTNRNKTKENVSLKKCICTYNQCGKIFETRSKLLSHKYHDHGHGKSKVSCNICGAQMVAFSLKTHMKIHTEKPCRCKICGKMLKHSISLRGHMEIHLNKGRLMKKCICKCAECGKIFDTKQKLQSHTYYHHSRLDQTKGVCNICGIEVRLCNLSKHVKIHSEAPCRCEVCGRTLKNSASLAGHMRIHSDKEFTCEVCGKIFNVKYNYTQHMRVNHADPDCRKTTCHLCGLKIVRKSMKRHMLKHTGERPYVCSYCQKGFTSPHALKVHIRVHTKEKPYLCEYCSRSFPQRVSLRIHLKKEHAISLIGNEYLKL